MRYEIIEYNVPLVFIKKILGWKKGDQIIGNICVDVHTGEIMFFYKSDEGVVFSFGTEHIQTVVESRNIIIDDLFN